MKHSVDWMEPLFLLSAQSCSGFWVSSSDLNCHRTLFQPFALPAQFNPAALNISISSELVASPRNTRWRCASMQQANMAPCLPR